MRGEVRVIVEHGVLEQGFHPAASVQDAIDRARGSGGVAWIGVQDPGDGELELILDAVGQDRRLLLLARRRGHAGFVVLRDHLLVTLIEVDDGGGDLAPIALQALVGADHVVVVLRGGSTDAVSGLRHRVQERLDDLAAVGPSGWVVLAALLLLFFDRYDRTMDDIEDTLQQLNDRLFPKPDDSVIQDTYRASQRVMRAGRAVRPLAHGLSEAAADDRFTRDATFHQAILRLRTVAEDLAERVTWAEQTVASLVDTVLGLTSQRTNELATRQSMVAQRISAYALLFAIPNAVFALYGVNFEHLPAILTRPYGYPVLLVLTAVLVALAAWRLRRTGWL
jgi:magnesium transporter